MLTKPGPVVALLGMLIAATPLHAASSTTLDYNRDVRPILAENCFHCHGQDQTKRKAKLRLDERDAAIAVRDGHAAIVPGKPEVSELIKRITTSDADDLMPPKDSHRQLTPEQIATLTRWVTEGAGYQRHWAFIAPVSARAPDTHDATWSRSPIDRFVAARLAADGLAPSPPTAPATWLRRASLDLTGLPATPAEAEAFAADVAKRGEAAYAATVDRLLADPRYGERQAQQWLDVARYADSHGFNNDTTRIMWRWRDWVIGAFNADLSYDRFITAQLAGDLLPQATLDDRIATGFCRNHVINSEGGIIDEEYRVEYVADRVRTLGMAFLGLTLECARCHNHKYDPISQREYYQLFACFDQVDEHGEDGRSANARPLIAAPTRAQQTRLAGLEAGISAADAEVDRLLASAKDRSWAAQPWSALANLGLGEGEALQKPSVLLQLAGDGLVNAAKPGSKAITPRAPSFVVDSLIGTVITPEAAGVWLGGDHLDLSKPWTITALVRWNGGEGTILSSMDWNAQIAATNYGNGNEVRITGDGRIEVRRAQMWPTYAVQVRSENMLSTGSWHHLAVSSDSGRQAAGIRVYLDGRECALTVLADDLGGSPGGGLRIGARSASKPQPFPGQLGDVRLYQSVADPLDLATVAEVRLARVLAAAPDQSRLHWAQILLARHHEPDLAAAWARGDALGSARCATLRQLPTTMVMAELAQPRTTHVLMRGQYDQPGDAVEPGIPEAIGVPWPSGAPRNRLGLAAWLTSADHPLTGRVVVNRLWQQLFGTGLVKSVEDFGHQGEFPSHPELLDWLSRRFVDGGWKVKALLKELVLSATYRQASVMTPALRERDPEGRLFARFPRHRIDAEAIRDQALLFAGLLRQRLGGPSVFPYQPDDLYKNVVVDAPYPGTVWTVSSGDDLYRRSLYTYWKRTVPHPVMGGFDVPDREACTARRARTNTPLQALTLMNETGFVEAARGLGARLLREGGADDRRRLAYGFRLVTGRVAGDAELIVLDRALTRLRSDFTADPAAAERWLSIGASPVDPVLPRPELAAYAAVASLLLNLDATITKD